MTEQVQQITETEWGLDAVLKDGLVIDDSNVVQTMEYLALSCKTIGKHRILLDATRITRKTSVVKMLNVAEAIQALKCGAMKIAIITPELANNETSRFLEDAALNRGVHIRYFSDRDAGLQWLLK
jgi:hypothetical protein